MKEGWGRSLGAAADGGGVDQQEQQPQVEEQTSSSRRRSIPVGRGEDLEPTGTGGGAMGVLQQQTAGSWPRQQSRRGLGGWESELSLGFTRKSFKRGMPILKNI